MVTHTRINGKGGNLRGKGSVASEKGVNPICPPLTEGEASPHSFKNQKIE